MSARSPSRRERANKENTGASASATRSVLPFPSRKLLAGADADDEDDEVEVVEVKSVDGNEVDDFGDLRDSDVDGEEGEGGVEAGARRVKWLVSDRKRLYEFVLGADADNMWTLLQKNRKRVFKKVSGNEYVFCVCAQLNTLQAVAEISFTGAYTADAAEKHYGRATKTYRAIISATGSTGGAGDIDANADRSASVRALTARLAKARDEGRNVGKLTAKVCDEWLTHGWLKLFRARYSIMV